LIMKELDAVDGVFVLEEYFDIITLEWTWSSRSSKEVDDEGMGGSWIKERK
jgi:hypothetical protein